MHADVCCVHGISATDSDVEATAASHIVSQERMDWLKVSPVVGLEVRVSVVAALGSCYSWAVSSLEASYADVPAWEGPAVNLTTIAILPQANHTVLVKVQDVSAPEAIALPPYSGMWYIVFCFLCAAFWVWGLGIWIVFGIPLIWWNVRSNAAEKASTSAAYNCAHQLKKLLMWAHHCICHCKAARCRALLGEILY
eukprot:365303-Chlamydomonas_euryale.AAC.44